MLFALRFQSRSRARVAVALLAGLSGACGQELKPNVLDWRVSFVCDADRAETQALRLRVLEGGCEQEGEPLYEAKLTRGEAPPAVDRMGSGSFGIAAIAYAEEQVIASTCVEVTLPRSEAISLKLRSPRCTVDTSDPVVSLDAAADAGSQTDAATAFDAATAPDAGTASDAETVADTGTASDAETVADTGTASDAHVIDPTTSACPSGCSDANPCTDACVTCMKSEDCDDRNPCTTDTCTSGSCGHTNNNVACDDGKSCTSNDVCAAGQCAGVSTCPSDASCGSSTCSCNDSSETLCGNSCVNLANEPGHCGLCGRSCVSGASCQNGACKPSSASTCTAHRDAGHDYLVCTDALNWSAARDRCRSFGLVLVAIDSQSENDFLRDRLGGAPRWIGANDLGATGNDCRLSGEEGSWYWASSTSDDGTLFCTAATSGAVSCSPVNERYQNWHYGEPNNGCSGCTTGCGEGQDCASIDPPGTWDDDSCSASFGYICETP